MGRGRGIGRGALLRVQEGQETLAPCAEESADARLFRRLVPLWCRDTGVGQQRHDRPAVARQASDHGGDPGPKPLR